MFWRGVWGYLPAQIVQGVVGFLTIVVFTRLLSPEDFGRYALAFSVTSLAHTVSFSWLEAAMAWRPISPACTAPPSPSSPSLRPSPPSPSGFCP